MKYIVIIFFSIILSSCLMVNSGNISSGPLLNVSDKKVASARGEAKAVFVFGLGNFDNDHLIEKAQSDLYTNRPLKTGEYYSNFACDIARKTVFLGVVLINKVTVSADILKSANAPLNVVLRDSTPNLPTQILPVVAGNYFVNDVDTFKMGESIYYEANDGSFGRYTIDGIETSSVILKGVEEKSQVKVNRIEPLFSTHKRGDVYSVGDTVKAKLFIGYSKAVIIA